MARPRKYPPELLDRGARVVIESGRPIAHVARDLGVPPETLRRHVRQVEADEGLRPDLPTAAEREEIKQLRQEVYELRRANEILKATSEQLLVAQRSSDIALLMAGCWAAQAIMRHRWLGETDDS
jgi:transposase